MFSLHFAWNFLAHFMFKLFAEFPIFENAEWFPYNFIVMLGTKTNEDSHVDTMEFFLKYTSVIQHKRDFA